MAGYVQRHIVYGFYKTGDPGKHPSPDRIVGLYPFQGKQRFSAAYRPVPEHRHEGPPKKQRTK
jgi:hypothetical protein